MTFLRNLSVALAFTTLIAQAGDAQVNDDDKGFHCAETSLQQLHYVNASCMKVKTSAQDRCAVSSLRRVRNVHPDCFKLDTFGGLCSTASFEVLGYVHSGCLPSSQLALKSHSADRCAAESLRRKRYVDENCYRLTVD